MITYLSGCVTPTQLAHPRTDLGFMFQPGMKNQTDLGWSKWAADNGCFAQGDNFDFGAWLEWLASVRKYRETCLFAVAPDVLGNAWQTWRRSQPYLKTIRQLGFKAAFVGQDGAQDVRIHWDLFDCWFVGGTDAWKFSQASMDLLREAKRRGKWVHIGRVNSLSRLQSSAIVGADSVDGTYVKFGPDRNLPNVYDWLESVNSVAKPFLIPA